MAVAGGPCPPRVDLDLDLDLPASQPCKFNPNYLKTEAGEKLPEGLLLLRGCMNVAEAVLRGVTCRREESVICWLGSAGISLGRRRKRDREFPFLRGAVLHLGCFNFLWRFVLLLNLVQWLNTFMGRNQNILSSSQRDGSDKEVDAYSSEQSNNIRRFIREYPSS